MDTTTIADQDYFTSKQGVMDLAEISRSTDNLNISAIQEIIKRLRSRCIRHSALTISRTVFNVLGENSSVQERQELIDLVMALDLTVEPGECTKASDNVSSLLRPSRRVKIRTFKQNYRTRQPFIPTPMSDSEQSLSPSKRNYDKPMVKKQRSIGKKVMSSHHRRALRTTDLTKSATYGESNSSPL